MVASLQDTSLEEESFTQTLQESRNTASALPLSHDAAMKWFYKDPQAEIQGTRTHTEMHRSTCGQTHNHMDMYKTTHTGNGTYLGNKLHLSTLLPLLSLFLLTSSSVSPSFFSLLYLLSFTFFFCYISPSLYSPTTSPPRSIHHPGDVRVVPGGLLLHVSAGEEGL